MAPIRAGIIEDNPDNAELLTTLLREDVGAEISVACSDGQSFFAWLGAEARRGARCPLDILLVDLRLGAESGYAILERVRRLPIMDSTKLIAITANVMAEDVAASHAAGFDGFIGKPINLQRFPKQIHQILAGEPIWAPR